VTAVEQHTGLNKSVVIEDTLKKVSDTDLEKSRARIAELFPDDDLPVDADGGAGGEPVEELAAANAEDAALVARLEQCRDALDEVDLEDIERLAGKLQEARRENDAEAAEHAREGIEDILFFAEQRN